MSLDKDTGAMPEFHRIIMGILILALVWTACVFSEELPPPTNEVTISIVASTETAQALGSLTAEDIRLVFLGKRTDIRGIKVHPIMLDLAEPKELFLSTYLKKSSSQYMNYWKVMVFTGKGRSPKSFDTESEVLEYVASHPGAIGFVTFMPESKEVSVITIAP